MRPRNRQSIDFAEIPKKRFPNGMLTGEAHKVFEVDSDIADLLCLICRESLIHEADDLYCCHGCGVAGEVVLVVDRLVSGDDPARLSIRLLQRKSTLSPKAWQHAEANHGFLISDLPCPNCKAPITRLIAHEDGVQPSCCQFVFIPEIKELQSPRPPSAKHIQQWQISYEEVEKIGIQPPTVCKIRCIDLHTYENEFARSDVSHHDDRDREGETHEGTSSVSPRTSRVAPKIQVPAVESEGVPHSDCVGQPLLAVSRSLTLPPPNTEQPLPTPRDERDVSKVEALTVSGREAITFFIRTFVRKEPNAMTPRHEFYEAYVDWIRTHNQHPLTKNAFHKCLREIYSSIKDGQNRIDGKLTRCYRGLKLRSDERI